MALRRDPVGLSQCLPDQPPGPQREPAPHLGIGRDGGPDPGDHELRVPRIGQHPEHESRVCGSTSSATAR